MAQPVLLVSCVPTLDGVPVAPCGTIGGIAHAPAVISDNLAFINTEHLGGLFSWSFSIVLLVFTVGFTIGSILRVIRSA